MSNYIDLYESHTSIFFLSNDNLRSGPVLEPQRMEIEGLSALLLKRGRQFSFNFFKRVVTQHSFNF